MNSSQLNFFMLPEDWSVFQDFMIKRSIIIVKHKTNNIDDFFLDPYDIKIEHDRPPFHIALTHLDFSDNILYTYNETSKIYDLNIQKSNIIEFSTGGFYASNFNKLHRARFYCVNSYYVSNEEVVAKNTEFKKWGTNTYRSFKRTFLTKYKDEKFILFTESTLKWMEENNAQIDGGYISISIKQ
ncbi:MAG: hypothetical protein JST68_07645 [Bacteroidetes bacterium]|nr:hypothetical protein [Bacteroidota bacterium]